MRRKNSKVSVVLATYNEKETIGEMISSLYEAIAPPLEVIVVDDASPDHTADTVKNLDFPDLLLIERKCRGLASAFNRGIIESSGDIICWLDADLCMPVETLCEMINLLDQYHMVIGSRYVIFRPKKIRPYYPCPLALSPNWSRISCGSCISFLIRW